MNSNVYNDNNNSIGMQQNNENNNPNKISLQSNDLPIPRDTVEPQIHDFKPPRFKNPALSPPKKIRRTSSSSNISIPTNSSSLRQKQPLQRANSDIPSITKNNIKRTPLECKNTDHIKLNEQHQHQRKLLECKNNNNNNNGIRNKNKNNYNKIYGQNNNNHNNQRKMQWNHNMNVDNVNDNNLRDNDNGNNQKKQQWNNNKNNNDGLNPNSNVDRNQNINNAMNDNHQYNMMMNVNNENYRNSKMNVDTVSINMINNKNGNNLYNNNKNSKYKNSYSNNNDNINNRNKPNFINKSNGNSNNFNNNNNSNNKNVNIHYNTNHNNLKNIISNNNNNDNMNNNNNDNNNNDNNKSKNIMPNNEMKDEMKDEMKKISYWGLPTVLTEGYSMEGIKTLYEWQVDCMNNCDVLRGGNLVYSAPTGGGKTLVAELLMLRNILRTKRKAIFVLPFVSIVVEKVRYFTKIFKRAKIKVKGFYSNKGGAGGLGRNCDIAICTIEKANSIVNRLITDNKLMDTIGIVILDEMHMIGDGQRGYILELLLTKIRYVQEKIGDQYRKSIERQLNILQHNDGEMLSQSGDGNQINAFPSMNPENDDATNRIQVVGLSATLPNLDVICNWLSATKYITNYRPIPLQEYIKIDNEIIDKHDNMIRKIGMRGGVKRHEDQDQISVLCAEVVQKKLSCIVFCHSKKQCQILAIKLSKLLPRMVAMWKNEKDAIQKRRESILFKLKKCSFGIDSILSSTIISGVAYHHAGLTLEERGIVEDAFSKGIINVITATSTLAAGVNLPARRVIFRNMKMGWNKIDIANYKQMSGRAGRAGKDIAGESILCIRKNQKTEAMKLMNSPLPPLKSCLSLDMVGLIRILNEAIASKIVKTVDDIERFIKCTLLKAQTDDYDAVHQAAHKAVKYLAHNNFIMWQKTTKCWMPTQLGLATFHSSMDPEHAMTLYRDLSMANKKIIIGDELHVIYQITPLPCFVNPPWERFIDVVERMSETRREIIGLLGLNMAFFNTLCHCGKPCISKIKERVRKYNDKSIEIEEKKNDDKNNKNKNKRAPKRDVNGLTFDHKVVIAQRLWAALMICDIVKEVPTMQIASKFNVDHGSIQSLQASVSTFAGMVNVFCEKLNWWELRILISEYQERVQFGFISKHEERKLKPFFKLGHNIMTKTIARVLYDNEITTIEQLANHRADDIQSVLAESTPFQLKQHSNRRRDGIDPRLGMKLVYVSQQFMKRKNQAQAKRLEKRDNALTQIGFKNAKDVDLTPSGTQYNMNHGYKVKAELESKKVVNPMDRLFHNNLHTQRPYTPLSVKPIPSNLLNTHNEELLKNKRFTPKKRSFCDITPSQIFTPSPVPNRNNNNNHNININNNNQQSLPIVDEPLNNDINIKESQHPLSVIPEQEENSNKMKIDEEEVHDPEEKESHLPETRRTPSQPINNNNTSLSQTAIKQHITISPQQQRCQSMPVINSHPTELIDAAVMNQVFADFFSPGNNGNVSGLEFNKTITPNSNNAVKQLSFHSISKTPNDNSQCIIHEPALKKRKLNTLHSQITSQVTHQNSTTHNKCSNIPPSNTNNQPTEPLEPQNTRNIKPKKCEDIPRIYSLVPSSSDDDELVTIDQAMNKLSQQLQDNANVDTPTQILVNETQYDPDNTPIDNRDSNNNNKNDKSASCSILFPETPCTPFGDCQSFERNVAKLLTQKATMCDLYIPGIIEINEDNEDDDFIQETQSMKKNNKKSGPLANRLIIQPIKPTKNDNICTPEQTLPAPKSSVSPQKKRSDKEEMSDDDDDQDTEMKDSQNKQVSPQQISNESDKCSNNDVKGKKLSNSEIRRRIRKEGGFGKVYLEKKSMNIPLNVDELNIRDEELERKLWIKCIPPCIKSMDAGSDSKIPFVPLVINVFVNEETYIDFISKWRKQRAFSFSLWGKYDQLPVMESELESAFAPLCRNKIQQLGRSHIGGFAISWSSKRSYIIELNHILRGVPDFVIKPMVWTDIATIFENPRTIKITYNSKMQLQILRHIGIRIGGKIWDPRIAHWLIEPDMVSQCKYNEQSMYHIFRSWCPKVLEAQGLYLDDLHEIHDQLVTIPPGKKSLSTVSRDHGLHVWRIWLCMHFMVSTLYRRKLLRAFLLVETKLIFVLTDMEYHGIGFDIKFTKKYEVELDCKINYLCTMAHTLCGQCFNLSSPKECSKILFNVLKLKPPQKAIQIANKKQRERERENKNKNKKPVQLSCNKEVLEQLIGIHPLPEIIMEYRTLSRFLQTYIEPLPRMTRMDKYFCIQRIHSSVLQTSTATGRLAMTWPNLQSVNKSIKFEAVQRYSVWEESKYRSDLSDFVTRLNVNENIKDLQVVVANCMDPTDATNVIIQQNEDKESIINKYVYGTLLTIHCDRTICDPFPGGNSLMQYWQEKGFKFKDKNITQCVVRINSNGIIKENNNKNKKIINHKKESSQNCMYTYPADKVWRVYAFEKIKKHESKDELIGSPKVDISSNNDNDLYPFQSINFCPRDSFIAPDGYILLTADYSQIELRILAHFANDIHLISAMKNGLDVMRDVASSITGKPYNAVSNDERQRAKTIVYGMLYGQTYKSLASELQININEAKQFYNKFRDKYPLSAQCLDSIITECRKKKYITTLLGRRRYLPHINELNNISLRMQAERQSVNSLCQGSAADLVKVAMIRIYDCFEMLEQDYHCKKYKKYQKYNKYKKYNQRPKYYAKLILQIHDELLFEVREDVIEYIAQIIKLTMENCMDLRVPLNVKMKIGKTWGNMKKYDI